MKNPARILVLTLFAMLTAVLPTRAQCDLESLELPTGTSTNDAFARSISIDGDVMVVGASADATWVPQGGAAYVYERVAGVWTLVIKLRALDTGSFRNFGTSVAVEGTRIVVGAQRGFGLQASTGAVYVFEKQGGFWLQTAKLWAPDGETGDTFGESVALSGDRIVVGAPMDDSSGFSWVGSAYMYSYDGANWILEDQVFPTPVNGSSWRFGTSVALQGDLAVVGAPTQGSGKAYVFRDFGSFWSKIQTITESAIYSQARFGHSVALSGNLLAVGSPSDHGNASFAGAVRVYDNTPGSFAFEQKLIASDGGGSDWFGAGIGLEGDTLLTGAAFHNLGVGAAYRYARSAGAWTEVEKRTAAGGLAGDFYGMSAALLGSTSIVGAVGHSSNRGAFYRYEPAPAPTVYCTATVNSLGCTPLITSTGWPSASSASSFTVSASNVVSGEMGLFFYGTRGAIAKPFLGGTRCVRYPLRRTPAMSSNGPVAPRDCTGAFALDFNAIIQSGLNPNLLPGTRVTGQFWYRDSAAAGGSGLTDAVDFLICP